MGLNYHFERKGINIKIGDYKDTKYTLILHTTHTKTGYSAGYGAPVAYISADTKFIETSKPENEIAIIEIKKSIYEGENIGYNTADYRIGQAYAKAGTKLAHFIWKNI